MRPTTGDSAHSRERGHAEAKVRIRALARRSARESALNCSHHDGEPLRRPGYSGIEPAVAVFGERAGLVEQHDIVPLRALRLVDGQNVAEIELVVTLARGPIQLLDGSGETFRPHRHLDYPLAPVLVGLEPHADDLSAALRALADDPQCAVEQSLAAIVAQADELVSRHGQCIGKAATLPQARVVRAPRGIAAHENLVRVYHARGVQRFAPQHLARAIAPFLQRLTGADHHRY